jgi:hypothetical protein
MVGLPNNEKITILAPPLIKGVSFIRQSGVPLLIAMEIWNGVSGSNQLRADHAMHVVYVMFSRWVRLFSTHPTSLFIQHCR